MIIIPDVWENLLSRASVGQLIAEGFLIVLCLDRVTAERGHSMP